MKQFLSIIGLLLLVATSCTKNVIDSDDMPNILADIYMTDRYILNDQKNLFRVDTSFVYEPILNKYGYSTIDFVHTMDYYLPRPTKLKKFFTDAKKILEEKELAISNKLLNLYQRDSMLRPIMNTIEKADSLQELDSYQRSLRWIIAPSKYPTWKIYLADSLRSRYEIPELTNWWANNLKIIQKPFLKYEKNSSPIYLPIDQSTDPERLSLPRH